MGWSLCHRPYTKEFRGDVVRVVFNRDVKAPIGQIAKNLGVHEGIIAKWLHAAGIADGNKPGETTDQSPELRAPGHRTRLLAQANVVLRHAAAYLSQANLPSKDSARS